eukprot:4243758-Amphidinium_carterae.1
MRVSEDRRAAARKVVIGAWPEYSPRVELERIYRTRTDHVYWMMQQAQVRHASCTMSHTVVEGRVSPISIVEFGNPEERQQFLKHWQGHQAKEWHGDIDETDVTKASQWGLKIGPQISPWDRLKSAPIHCALKLLNDKWLTRHPDENGKGKGKGKGRMPGLKP